MYISKLANIYSISIQAHTSMPILLFYLLLTSSSAYLISQSGRTSTYSPNAPNNTTSMPTYTVPLQYPNNNSTTNCAVVLSLNSFTYTDADTSIIVQLIEVGDTYFTYNATVNVYQVSYIVIRCDQVVSTRTINVQFVRPTLISVSELCVTSYVDVEEPWGVLQHFGTVQPFISGVFYAPGVRFTHSVIQVEFEWRSHQLRIKRSPHIIRLAISYISYVKIGTLYSVIQQYDPITIFALRESLQPVFVGIRSMNITNRPNRTEQFQMYSALWATSIGIEPQLYIVANKTTQCNQIIDGMNHSISQQICINQCNYTLSYILGYRVCSNHSYSLNQTQPYHNCNVGQETTYYVKNYQQCRVYAEGGQNNLYCKECNADNYFIKYADGSCMCKSGYYAQAQDVNDISECHQCIDDSDCPFVIDASMAVLKTQANSSEYIQVRFTINSDHTDAYPLYPKQYSSIKLEVLVNDTKPSINFQWVQPNSVVMQLRDYKYSNSYKVTINTKTSIFMKNQQQHIYLTPQTSRQLYYRRPQATKFIAESMGTISTFAPTAALISAFIGSKVNIFSFVQASSILYLSSYIKWENFGSIERVSLSQSMFKLTPTNLFASLNAHIPIPLAYSDDTNSNKNKMLSDFNNVLYTSVVPQFLISSIIQVLAIELIIRILMKVFPHPKHILGYKMANSHGLIRWHKKPFLIALIDAKQMQLKQYLAQLVQKVRTKRFIFYTTMMNSQLAFHSFMIFSQLSITVSTNEQIFNLFFSLLLLGVVIAIPCIGPHSPMILLKSIGIVYKKRVYRIVKLYIFQILGILQVVIYGASIALFDFSVYQCVGIVIIIAVKIFSMWGYIKRIQLAKHSFLLLYFVLLGVGTYFPMGHKKSMEIVAIILMFAVCAIQILKIIRSVIVALLGLLKEPASIKGLAIANRIVQRRNRMQE